MGTDSKLFNLNTKEKIYCDRLQNLHNAFTDALGMEFTGMSLLRLATT